MLLEDWYMLIAMCAVMIVIVASIINWAKLPNSAKIADIKEWLKFAVTEAEKKLKGGTGQLKLRMVYDMFIIKFPEVQRFITFEKFSEWVDDALEWLNKQLESNPAVKNYVYGEDI